MSHASSQFINQVMNDESKEMRHKERFALKWYDINKYNFAKFRANYEHGLIGECLIPLVFHYIFGTFSDDWVPSQNLIKVYLVLFFGYFRVQTVFENQYLFWALAILYIAYDSYVSIQNDSKGVYYKLVHFITLALNMELIPQFIPQQFSVSELFIYSSSSAYFTTFCIDSLIYREQRNYIPGCNISNILIFTPWVFLNVSGLTYAIVGQFFAKYVSKVMAALVCLGSGFICTFLIISPYNDPSLIWQFISEILFKDISLIMYMALTLLIGLGALNQLAPNFPNYVVRKGFHALAFMLFVPPIIMAKIDRPRMLIFAFNCVTVLLIIIEVLRYSGGILPETFSKWFKSMSNGRERIPANMIVTHIYLLMGCAFPPTASFILLSGGVYNSEWTLWSLSGVVFLGIGDSCAAVFGKQYGKTLWRQMGSKTQEGSSYLVISVAVTYWFLCHCVDVKSTYLFMCYIMAAVPAAVVEGCTFQYDNLSCSMLYFSLVIFFVTVFADKDGHY